MTLFRKLSFRPTVEELKARKVKRETLLAAVRRELPAGVVVVVVQL